VKLSIIAAVARNGVIGRDNTLPWRLPADLQHFKKTTTGHAIIMGRKNHEDIGRPLPNRRNIVITRDPDFVAEGCLAAHSLDEALALSAADDEVFVIGGAQIYALALPLANRLYLTEVKADVQGDVRFPHFDRAQWRETFRESHRADERNEYDYDFVILERTVGGR
jgi:dihydrofolate reductase